jgi:hypothetical protein
MDGLLKLVIDYYLTSEYPLLLLHAKSGVLKKAKCSHSHGYQLAATSSAMRFPPLFGTTAPTQFAPSLALGRWYSHIH